MIELDIAEAYRPRFDPLVLERAALTTLKHQGVNLEGELTIVVSDDDHLQTLNRRYRGIDSPTDVLSFAADFDDPDRGAPYLGDVLISYPRAMDQAADSGHRVEDELQLLVVHGVLHLLHHDHATKIEKDKMWAAQNEILAQLGLAEVAPK